MATRILTLDTLAERPTVCIDKTDYEMNTADDFSLVELAARQRLQSEFEALTVNSMSSDADIAVLSNALDKMTAMVLPTMPDDVRARLRDGQKLAIVQAFQQATEAKLAGTLPPNPPTGAP